MPLKEEAAELSDELGPAARQAGAVNTLTAEADGRIRGDNTDGLGLTRQLRNNLSVNLEDSKILIIGAGGAVRGVLPALLTAGVGEILIANRTRKRAEDLSRRFASFGRIRVADPNGEELPAADLVINASSAGMAGQPPALPPAAAEGALCIDLAYGRAAELVPWPVREKAPPRVSRGGGDLA